VYNNHNSKKLRFFKELCVALPHPKLDERPF
jgi:hypothetical protein